jgi:hypothetical protein
LQNIYLIFHLLTIIVMTTSLTLAISHLLKKLLLNSFNLKKKKKKFIFISIVLKRILILFISKILYTYFNLIFMHIKLKNIYFLFKKKKILFIFKIKNIILL